MSVSVSGLSIKNISISKFAHIDPYWNNVSVLLQLNGSNGSTSFPDSSDIGNTFTAAGNASIRTSQSVFFGSSLYLDGSGDWIQSPTNLGSYSFGTNDFTVEGWFYFLRNNVILIDTGWASVGSFQIYCTSSNKIQWWNLSNSLITSSASISLNAWNYIAITRQSGTLRVFIGGTLSGTVSDSTNYNDTATTATIGAQVGSRNSTYDFYGYISDIRITKNVARYTATFTPPAAPFPIN